MRLTYPKKRAVKKRKTLASKREKRLPRSFFADDTQKVAQALLGKILVRESKAGTLAGKIVETEAYMGTKDKAAHVYKDKKTERNKVVYKKAGFIYIYLCYGIHWQLNFTTGKKDEPECILIRALEPIAGEKEMLKNREEQSSAAKITKTEISNGPGKLCQALQLDRSFYGEDLTTSNKIWVKEGKEVPEDKIKTSPRVGIDYAEEYADKPWRYFVERNEFVSNT